MATSLMICCPILAPTVEAQKALPQARLTIQTMYPTTSVDLYVQVSPNLQGMVLRVDRHNNTIDTDRRERRAKVNRITVSQNDVGLWVNEERSEK